MIQKETSTTMLGPLLRFQVPVIAAQPLRSLAALGGRGRRSLRNVRGIRGRGTHRCIGKANNLLGGLRELVERRGRRRNRRLQRRDSNVGASRRILRRLFDPCVPFVSSPGLLGEGRIQQVFRRELVHTARIAQRAAPASVSLARTATSSCTSLMAATALAE